MAGIGSVRKQKLSDMRHRITIQSPVETIAATGQPVVTWSNFATSQPAEYIPANGSEGMRGRQLEANVKGVFKMNYLSGVTTKMQIVHNGVNYGIVSVNASDGINRNLEIMVKT